MNVQEPIDSQQTTVTKRPRRIFIAGASARAAAWSAWQSGLKVVAADLFGDQDLRAVCEEVHVIPSSGYPDSLLDIVARINQADAWLYTGGLENYPGFD